MKINIPENISEVTLGQFQKYMELLERDLDIMTFNKRKVSIFTNVPYKELLFKSIRAVDFERISKQVDLALNTAVSFESTFKLDGLEFGFINDFEEISLGEFADLEKYQTSQNDLHNLMAILFRPIRNKAHGRYEIESYKGTAEYAEQMKLMPLNIANGALVFFLNLANELEDYTLKYSSVE
jgi:trehalose/maltose hydrolase-like predicted phosphorylase